MFKSIYRRIRGVDEPASRDPLPNFAPLATYGAALGLDTDTANLTFLSATPDRMAWVRDWVPPPPPAQPPRAASGRPIRGPFGRNPPPAQPPRATSGRPVRGPFGGNAPPPRVASGRPPRRPSGGNQGRPSVPSRAAASRPPRDPARGQETSAAALASAVLRAPENTYPLPEHLMLELALVSANGCQNWCPTAALLLARYAHARPAIASDPAYGGLLTATAMLVATKLLEGGRRWVTHFAPVCGLLLERSGDFFLDPQTAVADLIALENDFLESIHFSLAAPHAVVERYGRKLEMQRLAYVREGGIPYDWKLSQAIDRLF